MKIKSSQAEHEPQRDCWDNAVAESFFGSLKKERIKKSIYEDRETAVADISEYIESIYNWSRCYSHLRGVSPQQFEAKFKRRPIRLQ